MKKKVQSKAATKVTTSANEDEYIKVYIDYREVEVKKRDYIDAKLKGLIEFGYTSLKRETVATQLEKALAGKKLDVIGMFIDKDLVKK